nr:RNA polymerase-binding protein DksA [uncultured Hyphomicrobium sp.]
MSKRATSKPVKSKAAVKAKAAPKPAAKSAAAKSKPARPAAKPAKATTATKTSPKAVAQKSSASQAKPRTQAIDKAKDKKLTAKAGTSTIVLSPDYRPSEDEPFMNERHRMYFRQKLTAWKEEIIRQTKETLAGLHEDSTQHADLADRATSETDRALELRARDRQRKLIAKIDAALARIEDGTYGYCEETGEPIGLKRLDARPIATLSLEAQERHERRERVYRED